MKKVVWLAILGALVYVGYTRFVQPSSAEEAPGPPFGEAIPASDGPLHKLPCCQAGEPGSSFLADPETAEKMSQGRPAKAPGVDENLTHEKAIARAQN